MAVTIANKVVGNVSAPHIGGVDFQLDKITIKAEQAKISLTPMGQGGWKYSIPGGEKSISGSFEGSFDVTLHTGIELSEGGFGLVPWNCTVVAFSIPIGTVVLSFNATVSDIDIDKSNAGLVTLKGNYESCGPLTVS